MDIHRHVSAGSVWELDNDLNRYRRYPRTEGPREVAEWSDERAGSLQDAVWHDMVRWYLDNRGALRIELPTGRTIFAPPALANDPVWAAVEQFIDDHPDTGV